MDDSTRRFLEGLNVQNQKIAAQETELPEGVGVDPYRVQRDQERREKYGQLRAREKASKRPNRARRLFPYVDPL